MSVYTKITEDELSEHLEKYTIGVAIDLTGISDGIELSLIHISEPTRPY